MNRRAAAGLLLLIAGAALLVWQIRDKGAADILEGFRSVGAWFGVILLLSLLRFVARTRAWTSLIDTPVPAGRALAATLGGDAIGNVTPLGLLASEPAKALYLGRYVAPARALAALMAETFFYTISVAIYIVLGTASMLEFFALDDAVRMAAWIALASMGTALAAAAWLAWRQPNLLSAMLAYVPVAKLRTIIDRIRDFELQAYGSARGRGGPLAVVVACEVTFHVLSYLEAWLTLWLLTGQSLPLAALVLDTFQRVSNIVFKMIPFRLGVDQVGSEMVAIAIGLPPGIGLQMSLVRTGRVIVWAVVGLATGAATTATARRP